jgi:hypothetical protein
MKGKGMEVTIIPYQLMQRRKRFIVLRCDMKGDRKATMSVKTGMLTAESSSTSA